MADAKKDANRVPALIAVSSADGETPLRLYVDPTTNRLYVTSVISGSVSVGKLTLAANNQVTVDTTAGGVEIVAADADTVFVQITNQGSVGCYIGKGTVSTANGFYLGPGESIPLPTNTQIKGITASSSTTVGFLRYE